MTPLQITAVMVSPVAAPGFPVALDGLLASAVCMTRNLVAGVGDREDIDVPVQRSPCGRFYLASMGHYLTIRAAQGFVHRRAPVTEYMQIGGPKIRSVDTGTGRNKSYRIPQAKALIDLMRWWTIGEESAIRDLLRLVTHLGRRRSVGHGKIGRWEITPVDAWPGFPSLRPDGSPMRNLPLDVPGIGPSASIGWGPLVYPYWDQSMAVEVAQPADVEWMGPS